MLNKSKLLSSAVDTCNADIIALTETWLHPETEDGETFFATRHFSIFRHDHSERQGGGVFLGIRKDLPSHVVQVASSLETVWAVTQITYQK